MKLQIGMLAMAFFGGMAVHDTMTADEVVWVDYGEDPMTNPKFMQDWMASTTPGEAHAALGKTAGDWTVATRYWMGPDMPPNDAKATSSRKMILGGRYLVEEYKSEFMGMPFEGMLIQGYDNLQEDHFTIWIDNMSTGPSMARGKMDEAGSVHHVGLMRDVATPAGRPYRHVTHAMEEGKMTFDMFDSKPEGGEFKVMELSYTKNGN